MSTRLFTGAKALRMARIQAPLRAEIDTLEHQREALAREFEAIDRQRAAGWEAIRDLGAQHQALATSGDQGIAERNALAVQHKRDGRPAPGAPGPAPRARTRVKPTRCRLGRARGRSELGVRHHKPLSGAPPRGFERTPGGHLPRVKICWAPAPARPAEQTAGPGAGRGGSPNTPRT
jgi:hypothetical protein